jgi:hypothetical protein
LVTNGDITMVDTPPTDLDSVLELTVQGTILWWGNITGATGYDVVQGDLNQLRATAGDFSDPTVTETCSADDQTATYLDHSMDVPAPGEGHWYLMRGQPGSLADGTYESGGIGQVGTRETEIGSSGNGCP